MKLKRKASSNFSYPIPKRKKRETISTDTNGFKSTFAGCSAAGAPGMPPVVPPVTSSSIVPLGGAIPQNPALPPQMRPPNTMGMMPPPTMPGMPTGMSSGMPPMPGMVPPQTTALPTDHSAAGTAPPPPYSSSNQPQYPSHVFAAPNPGPLRTTVTSAITPEARKQIMEQQMHEKLAQQQQLFEQQRIQREQREREARERQERQLREQRMPTDPSAAGTAPPPPYSSTSQSVTPGSLQAETNELRNRRGASIICTDTYQAIVRRSPGSDTTRPSAERHLLTNASMSLIRRSKLWMHEHFAAPRVYDIPLTFASFFNKNNISANLLILTFFFDLFFGVLSTMATAVAATRRTLNFFEFTWMLFALGFNWLPEEILNFQQPLNAILFSTVSSLVMLINQISLHYFPSSLFEAIDSSLTVIISGFPKMASKQDRMFKSPILTAEHIKSYPKHTELEKESLLQLEALRLSSKREYSLIPQKITPYKIGMRFIYRLVNSQYEDETETIQLDQS